MFRKIHSNRAPGVTVYSELKKEFSAYYYKLRESSRSTLQSHPKSVFACMVILMTVSVFFVFTHHQPPQPPKKTSPVSFQPLLKAGNELNTIFSIKKEVDSITAKKMLSRQDSVTLEHDLDQLQKINPYVH